MDLEPGSIARVVAVHVFPVDEAQHAQLLERLGVVLQALVPDGEPYPHPLVQPGLDIPVEPGWGLFGVVPRVCVVHPPPFDPVHLDLEGVVPVLDVGVDAVTAHDPVHVPVVLHLLAGVARDLAGQAGCHCFRVEDEGLDGRDVVVLLQPVGPADLEVPELGPPVLP